MIFKEFFYLQKSDRKVILTLLCVVAISLTVIFVIGSDDDNETALLPADSLSGQTFPSRDFRSTETDRPVSRSDYYGQYKAPSPERFTFDPNTADSSQLLRLGLQDWQVRNIYKYRAAGGIYRKPEDFSRLYGLTRKQYRELKPYIKISEDYLPASTRQESAHEPVERRDTARYPVKLKPQERIELNKADTSQLRMVPGIGSYFASRIVQYRRQLGGFHATGQLLEIENFPESAVQYFIILDHDKLQKLNVNKLTLSELRRHPYINFYQAKAITDYRRLHGSLKSLSDLRLSKDFPQEAIERLAPYVEY